MIKQLIAKIDEILFNRALLRWYYNIPERALNRSNGNLDYKFVVHYNKNMHSTFSQLCDKYGSDKGEIRPSDHPYPWPSHTYADYYSRLFDHCRVSIKNVFECGLGTNDPSLISSMGAEGKPGASLRIWRDYFPNAYIFGADIDKNILFEENRIKTFYVDQTDTKAIETLWSNVNNNVFDLIIDDGLHTFEAGVSFFENSFSNLRKGGIYIIEDVSCSDMVEFQKYFTTKDYKVEFVNLYRPYSDLLDNSLIVIRNI